MPKRVIVVADPGDRPLVEVLAEADSLIEFYGADPQGIGTARPCVCAQRAIEHGYMKLDPDCRANRCRELRA